MTLSIGYEIFKVPNECLRCSLKFYCCRGRTPTLPELHDHQYLWSAFGLIAVIFSMVSWYLSLCMTCQSQLSNCTEASCKLFAIFALSEASSSLISCPASFSHISINSYFCLPNCFPTELQYPVLRPGNYSKKAQANMELISCPHCYLIKWWVL